MKNKIKKVFSSQVIFEKNNLIYRLVRLNTFFSAMTLPWFVVNGLIKFTPQTFPLYGLGAIWLIPNIQTLFICLEKERDFEPVTFNRYLKQLRNGLKRSFLVGSLSVVLLGILLFELMIVLTNRQLTGMFPLFFIGIMMGSVTLLYLLRLQRDHKQLSFKQQLKMALVLGWHNPLQACLCFLVLILWISLGYQLPLINLLIGNVACFYFLDRLMTRFTGKFLIKLQNKSS